MGRGTAHVCIASCRVVSATAAAQAAVAIGEVSPAAQEDSGPVGERWPPKMCVGSRLIRGLEGVLVGRRGRILEWQSACVNLSLEHTGQIQKSISFTDKSQAKIHQSNITFNNTLVGRTTHILLAFGTSF